MEGAEREGSRIGSLDVDRNRGTQVTTPKHSNTLGSFSALHSGSAHDTGPDFTGRYMGSPLLHLTKGPQGILGKHWESIRKASEHFI